MLTFVGVGHSHVVALANGAHRLRVGGTLFDGAPLVNEFHYLYAERFEPPLLDGHTGTQLNPAILDVLRAHAPRFVMTSIGGNEHNVLAIAQGKRPFDFILSGQPDLPLDPQAELLPEAVVRETLRHWMVDKIALLTAIRAAVSVPVIQIEPPPPVPRAHVLATPSDAFKKSVDLRRLSSDTLRHKMWRVETRLFSAACGRLGIDYVETPPAMMDETGMLAQSAWGKDATHANDAYGEVMVGQALRMLGDRVPARAGG